MQIICISASNVEPAREHSASTRACELIRELAQAECDAQVDILPLIDYELTPCRMCSKCLAAGNCIRDNAFNQIYARLAEADAVFVVCPHYAPLPSKLMMLLEKLEEICYLNWCQNQQYQTIVYRKPIGLVAHGGQPNGCSAVLQNGAARSAGVGFFFDTNACGRRGRTVAERRSLWHSETQPAARRDFCPH